MAHAPAHPLLEYLESSEGRPGFEVARVERHELRSSSLWGGHWLSYVLRHGPGLEECFRVTDHADASWAAGALMYQWLVAMDIPTDAPHLTDVLFAIEDVLVGQQLKCWFFGEYVHGKCRARPIIKEFDVSSPGNYFSINDYLHQPPGQRSLDEVLLRLHAVMLAEHRCPDRRRVLTLTGDDGRQLHYRIGKDGTRETVADQPMGPDDFESSSLDEIIEIANSRKTRRTQRPD